MSKFDFREVRAWSSPKALTNVVETFVTPLFLDLYSYFIA